MPSLSIRHRAFSRRQLCAYRYVHLFISRLEPVYKPITERDDCYRHVSIAGETLADSLLYRGRNVADGRSVKNICEKIYRATADCHRGVRVQRAKVYHGVQNLRLVDVGYFYEFFVQAHGSDFALGTSPPVGRYQRRAL